MPDVMGTWFVYTKVKKNRINYWGKKGKSQGKCFKNLKDEYPLNFAPA